MNQCLIMRIQYSTSKFMQYATAMQHGLEFLEREVKSSTGSLTVEYDWESQNNTFWGILDMPYSYPSTYPSLTLLSEIITHIDFCGKLCTVTTDILLVH